MSTDARTDAMDSWESLIASRMRPCATMPKEEDTSKRAKKIGSDRYEKSEKRRASHKAWEQSEAGKKSMHDRGERYRHTENGVQNSRKKASKYYYRSIIFKDDALNALEKDDVVSYNLLSKKSDNCYRHANRWRRIFRKMSQE